MIISDVIISNTFCEYANSDSQSTANNEQNLQKCFARFVWINQTSFDMLIGPMLWTQVSRGHEAPEMFVLCEYLLYVTWSPNLVLDSHECNVLCLILVMIRFLDSWKGLAYIMKKGRGEE